MRMNMKRPPNILFFLPDQHRGDYLGLQPGNPVRTPTIDALAARGTWFPNTICPSPLCAPSRACLASGTSYGRSGVMHNGHNYPTTMPTYYQHLRDAGYRVAGVGKFDLHKDTHWWGLDGSHLLAEWGFTEGIDNEGKIDAITSGADKPKGPYMAYLHQRGLAAAHVEDFRTRQASPRHGRFRPIRVPIASAGKSTHESIPLHILPVPDNPVRPTPLPDDAYCDNWIAENGLRFLRDFPFDQPWHLVVNFTGPHSPWDVTEDMYRRWQGIDFPDPVSCPQAGPQAKVDTHDMSPELIQQIRRNYAAMIENIDYQCGRLIDAVRKRGQLDNTLVVYASDHGEMLYDHGLHGKQVPYQPSISVPLIVAGPGVRQGATSDALVQLYDLAATFLDYAGAEPLPDVDALSMCELLAGSRTSHRGLLHAGLDGPGRPKDHHWRCAFDGRFKLVVDYFDQPALFDLQEDPHETVNCARQYPDVYERLVNAVARSPAPCP